MQEATIPLLKEWESFYVIVGSAAAVLIGLTFIVITISSGTRSPDPAMGVTTFSTPTVVHFSTALLISMLFCAPWPMLWHLSLLLGLTALAGNIYLIIILRRTLRQSTYQMVLEDWVWRILFPFISYIAFIITAIALPGYSVPALYVTGAATILLLFIGIHNSWDTVLYITTQYGRTEQDS